MSNQPNVVFILSDDQGAWALGCYGNTEIRTPNLDRLAARGVRFGNFFCTSPVCSPARASLLTGKIPSQHGVHDWIKDGNVGERPVEYLAGHTAYTEILAANGYHCGMSGKWHLGHSALPQKGFSHWFVHQSGGSPYVNAPMIRNGQLVEEPGYITDVITDDALEYIEERAKEDRPFYVSVHYTAPHSPWIGQHPQHYVDLYENCPFDSCPQEPKHPWSTFDQLEPTVFTEPREHLKGYYAAITAMDDHIGRILDRLDSLDLTDHTLVCFLSDNGFSCGQRGIWGKGNGTFPLNMFDSSVRVPAIMSHPGRIPEGLVCDELLSGYDFMPTLLDYLGFDYPESERLPGRSFLPLLLGQPSEGREGVVIYDEYGPVRMVRTKTWKYIHRYPYGPHELYDLVSDPGERDNLIDDQSKEDVLRSMRAMLDDWFHQYVDPAKDGAREPVAGGGQTGLSGLAGRGRQAFE
ncbi:Ulvan-active sulfatase [Paenibacillus sp. CECT 9249]|uniref:sulfatase-like hydrolase/transferase n=1 Tax=Paenibacillus sp. CECT 9249 TaxID=2845385 RepID=UPI001E30BAE8|nr:sulfatase-like hydrolase/transferase [Paenibacillus sp. CECT 9249]CAH0121286.1 Ulvan-active sulfatase [Paenibacillus sp. CECT 9249]